MTALEIGANLSLGHGMAGGAPGSELMVLKAMDASGQGNAELVGEAIRYAVDHGASVINLSLGANAANLDIQNALQYAYEKGAIVVAAAGNDGDASLDFPAAYAKLFPNMIAVGACQNSGQHNVLASYSNQAGLGAMYNFVDAIGTDITGYTLDGNLATWSGTSMAAPLVAAEASILKSGNPQLSAYEIVQDILHSCHSLDDMLTHVSASQKTTVAPTSLDVSSASVSLGSDFNNYSGTGYLHDSLTYVPTEQHY
jgi:subtilisin family serine protease